MNGNLDMAKLISRNNKNQSKLQTECNGSGREETNCKLLGMVSNNMSIITIFGHMLSKQISSTKFVNFYEKNSIIFNIASYLE